MKPEGFCVWIYDDIDGCFLPSCGDHALCWEGGNPESDGIRFCGYCGKRISHSEKEKKETKSIGRAKRGAQS